MDQLPDNYQQHFQENQVQPILHQYETFKIKLHQIISENKLNKCWVSPTSGYAVHSIFPDKKIYQDVSFSLLIMVWKFVWIFEIIIDLYLI